MRRSGPLTLAGGLFAASTVPSAAHEAGGGFILLLPTENYIAGAALAVLASFLVLAVVPPSAFHRFYAAELVLWRSGDKLRETVSVLSTLFVAFLIYMGVAGPDDPLTNPITLGTWTLGWITMTLLCAIFGDLWPSANPWTGLLRLLGLGAAQVMRLPRRLGYSVSLVQLAYLLWIDRVSLHATDPERLAVHLGLFWSINALGMVIFGIKDWTERAEPLHLVFRLVGLTAPIVRDADNRVALHWPGAAVLKARMLAPGMILFAALLLSSGTFDGIASTFRWIVAIGENPLEFHGRSSAMVANTVGLVVTWAVVFGLFLACVGIGRRMAGVDLSLGYMAGHLAYSLVPISVAYLASHFTTRLVMDYQYLWKIVSDPLRLGWDLFGTASYFPSQSVFNTETGVYLIWACQTLIITFGHVVAVVMAHGSALEMTADPRKGIVSQAPLAVFMVAYTALGLWLLASPRI